MNIETRDGVDYVVMKTEAMQSLLTSIKDYAYRKGATDVTFELAKKGLTIEQLDVVEQFRTPTVLG